MELTEILEQIRRRHFNKTVNAINKMSSLRELEAYVKKHYNRVNWDAIAINRRIRLSEKFIDKYAKNFNWKLLSIYQRLSEKLIEKHSDAVDWKQICLNQRLSEKFIEKHADKVDWCSVFLAQNISPNFILKHIDKLEDLLSGVASLINNDYQPLNKFNKRQKWKLFQKINDSYLRQILQEYFIRMSDKKKSRVRSKL